MCVQVVILFWGFVFRVKRIKNKMMVDGEYINKSEKNYVKNISD